MLIVILTNDKMARGTESRDMEVQLIVVAVIRGVHLQLDGGQAGLALLCLGKKNGVRKSNAFR